jgi:hypothetical protein
MARTPFLPVKRAEKPGLYPEVGFVLFAGSLAMK